MALCMPTPSTELLLLTDNTRGLHVSPCMRHFSKERGNVCTYARRGKND